MSRCLGDVAKYYFFFQAEDGIRDADVTGVQTCALPISVLLAGVGVTPQDCGALGKVANCQVGVSVHAATDQASCPINWRLFLPPSGTTTPSGAARPTCPTTCTIGPSGSWPWTWWTSWPAGSWPRR